MEVKLFVGNLPYLTTDDNVRTLFAQAGTVAAAVIKDRDSGTSKCFGFVAMLTRAEAENVIKILDSHPMGEHTLRVNLARPRIDHSSGYRRQRSSLV